MAYHLRQGDAGNGQNADHSAPGVSQSWRKVIKLKLTEFQNPLSGREDNIANGSTWIGFILGFIVLIVSGMVAMAVVTAAKAKLAGVAAIQKLNLAGLGLGDTVAKTPAATPADPTGPSALGFVAQA